MEGAIRQFLNWSQQTREMNSDRIFLFIFLLLRDFVNADLICALVASVFTENSVSCDRALAESPKYVL